MCADSEVLASWAFSEYLTQNFLNILTSKYLMNGILVSTVLYKLKFL